MGTGMTSNIVFDPLVPLPVIVALAVLVVLAIVFAAWRGLAGWIWRGGAGLVILAALTGPVLRQEDRAPLKDIVLLVEDRSASDRLGDRAHQLEQAATAMAERISARPDTELRRVTVGDGEGDTGTLLMTAVSEALAEEPRARVAGVILLSDGQLHDLDQLPSLPAPMQLLLTGMPQDWDRRLVVTNAPAFGIIDEPVTLTVRIEDQGAIPAAMAGRAELSMSIDGGDPVTVRTTTGRDFQIPVTLTHGGRNVIQFFTPEQEGELTDRNNSAIVQMNGVRDRLRVLLVSGEPHAGERTWRNLLKSDSSVDLVHFTILRPPSKQDGVPVSELSLIAFPTRELFMDKINDFDLIIFDRYKRRGILPTLYLDNIRKYVDEGGAVLIAAGPDFASADSLYRSPLSQIIPVRPTAHVFERGFTPKVTDLGERHPVTAGLEASWDGPWGRWMRQVDVTPERGEVVMSGVDDEPLLILDRVEKGRVALLASDQAWLWTRGFEGGGPQLELLRRLAHWMMKEPDLEEEALVADAVGQTITIRRRSLKDEVGTVTITGPEGEETQIMLAQTGPGRFEGTYQAPEIGLYRLKEDDLETVIGLGPAAPKEFEKTIASGEALEPAIDETRGGVLRLSDGLPVLRDVRAGRPAAGRGWIGLTPRDAYETRNVTQHPLLPAWLVLILTAGLILAGWLREGRR